MKQVAGKHVYLLANLYNPAAYEWPWLNCYIICMALNSYKISRTISRVMSLSDHLSRTTVTNSLKRPT